MLRIALCLLFAVASATVAAREVKMSSPGSGACPDKQAAEKDVARRSARSAVPARETKVKPSVHSDVPSGRLQSPRWHSFLPGMFR